MPRYSSPILNRNWCYAGEYGAYDLYGHATGMGVMVLRGSDLDTVWIFSHLDIAEFWSCPSEPQLAAIAAANLINTQRPTPGVPVPTPFPTIPVILPDDLPNTLPPAPSAEPILVTIDFRRDKGKAIMRVDARPLHAYLERIGVTRDIDGNYDDRPRDGHSNPVTARYNQIAYNALLAVGGPHEYNLMESYSNYPSVEIMREIGNSVEDKVNCVVDHYRPVEISVVIHGKGR